MNEVSGIAVINQLIKNNNLKTYLELSHSLPSENFNFIKAKEKILVNPGTDLKYYSVDNFEQQKQFVDFQVTTAEFFNQNTEKFDLIVINADHSYENSLSDLNQALKIVNLNGFVVLFNSFPSQFTNTQRESYEAGLFYTGEVWKTVLSAIRQGQDSLKIKTYPWSWGITVIKKISENISKISALELDWERDFDVHALNPEYDVTVLDDEIVSYFTPTYNIPILDLSRTMSTLIQQTNPHWEWVVLDDSTDDQAANLIKACVEAMQDNRMRYFRMSPTSNGVIGEVKKRVTTFCRGKYLAELDHDDLLMPELTDYILKKGEGYDFLYSNFASVRVSEEGEFSDGEVYGDGFAMGYGAYRLSDAVNPLTGNQITYKECLAAPINPKTIRHIVGVPNHVRVWNREFYYKIQAHNPDLWVVDDYELIVRTFLAGGKFLHLDMLGYLQVYSGNNTTDARRGKIQELVSAVLMRYDNAIKAEFERRGIADWAYAAHQELFGFKSLQYWGIPTIPDSSCANDQIDKI
ncbi:MAG: glycosyltransferase [Streptococcaceae bacterium]|jgi:glycosyltransferase involved in cell wall biosynthesis|nr:glycosyltransferase [Streptococcaceae bacterium]